VLRGDVGVIGERPRLGGELDSAVRRSDVVLRSHEEAARLACGFPVERVQEHDARRRAECQRSGSPVEGIGVLTALG
jgi:hypothetical protein